MTSKDKHSKHVALVRPDYGEFGRNELAILGSTCDTIQKLANSLISHLSSEFSMAYVDADHRDVNDIDEGNRTDFKESIRFTDKIRFQRIDFHKSCSKFDTRVAFGQEDIVIINGNHFLGEEQILIIDSRKSLEKKTDRLTNVKLIIMAEGEYGIPEYLKTTIPDWENKPVFYIEETEEIINWLKTWLRQRAPVLKGLILAGGESKRMGMDKSGLDYHGKSQRKHLLDLIQPFCSQAFLSCNSRQAPALKDKYPIIEDTFFGLGPMGGILSAFRADPNAAWLILACDLPYLSERTIQYLLDHRNPSKVATAFMDTDGVFPEPLITIWEPKSYPLLLQYLGQGYSCPRKVLINTDVKVVEAPSKKELFNANRPEEYAAAIKELRNGVGG